MSSCHRRRAIELATAIGFLGFGAGCGQGSDGDDDLGSGGRGVLAGDSAGAVSETTGGSELGDSGGGQSSGGTSSGGGGGSGGAAGNGTGGPGTGGATGGTSSDGGSPGSGGAPAWPSWVYDCVSARQLRCSVCIRPDCVMCVYGSDAELEQTGVICSEAEADYRDYCNCDVSGSICPMCREEWR